MFKALLLPNYISEQPQFFRDASNLPNIEKIILSTLWLSKVKGHGYPNMTVSSSCYKFSKIFKPHHGFISWYFTLIFGRIVADKIIFDLIILLQNRKRFVRYLGPNLAWNEKTRKVGYLSHLGFPWSQWKMALEKFSYIHYDMASLLYKIHEWFSIFSQRKNLTKFVQKTQILFNTQVLIFTIFHDTIVI